MKRIMITGAGGYIGRNVVKKLLDLGYEVVAVDVNTNAIDKRACIITYNIFQETADNLYEYFHSPDICLHLAWRDGFVHNSEAHLCDLPKHLKFIENLLNGGLTHLAVLGSMHEVGYHVGSIDENTAANPQSMYGISKNALRQAIQVLHGKYSFSFQWLRAYYIYGDDYNNHSIFTKLLQSEKDNKEFFPLNSGTNKYDFMHINDLTTEIAASILQNNINGIINCCLGKPVSLKHMVQEFIAANHLSIRLKIGAFPDRPYDSPIVYGDNTKIKSILQNYIQCNDKNADVFNETLRKMQGEVNETN